MIYKLFKKIENIGMLFFAGVFLFGALLWAGVIGFPDALLMSYGCILAIASLAIMVCYGSYHKSGRPILSLLTGGFLFLMIFFAFCWMGIVPFVESRPIFGLISLPLFLCCSGTTTTTIISVKTKGRYGQPEEQSYEVKTKERSNGVKEVISIKRISNKGSKK